MARLDFPRSDGHLRALIGLPTVPMAQPSFRMRRSVGLGSDAASVAMSAFSIAERIDIDETAGRYRAGIVTLSARCRRTCSAGCRGFVERELSEAIARLSRIDTRF